VKEVKVIQPQNKEDEIPVEILAQSIADISAGMKKLKASKLNDKALVLLIQDASKVSKTDINSVLEALENLERIYLKPKKEQK
jgi:hypothetical protein